MLPLFQAFKIMKDCDGPDGCPKPLKRSYYSMEKAICTPFFLKISRKICGFPKIHGGQSSTPNAPEICRISDEKMQAKRMNGRTEAAVLTGAQKKYIHGSNYAIMKKKREGMRHEEGKA